MYLNCQLSFDILYIFTNLFVSVDLVERVDKQAIITRLLNPLVQPGHKL